MNRLDNSKSIGSACVALGLVLTMMMPTVLSAKLYKWTDEEGVVHYSDKMPPESSKGAHKELDQLGRKRREVERAKTDEERLLERMEKTQEEQERRAEAQIIARQRMRDHILLQTFTTERDLNITRDDRINAIDSIINLTITNNNRIAAQIEETKSRIARIEDSGREVPENITKRLENLNEQYEKNKGFIERKQAKRKEADDGFAADLKRFRELKGIEPESDAENTEQPDTPTNEQADLENVPTTEADETD